MLGCDRVRSRRGRGPSASVAHALVTLQPRSIFGRDTQLQHQMRTRTTSSRSFASSRPLLFAAQRRCALRSPPPLCSCSLRVYRGGWPDVDAVASLCSSAFVEAPGALPTIGFLQSVEGYQEHLADAFLQASQKELRSALWTALLRKEEATKRARSLNSTLRAVELRAELSRLQRGEPESAVSERRAVPLSSEALRDRRSRQWMLLLTRDDAGLTGCAVLSWSVPEAALPPPFPSSQSWQLYLTNMAVEPRCRRAGVASSLLSAAERLARRWGESEVMLHVDEANASARALYEKGGFEAFREDAWWVPPQKRRLLLRKGLPGSTPLQPIRNQ